MGPSLTAAARDGVANPRSGQKKACGAVEQKKEPEQARKSAKKVSARKKELAFGVAIRERKNGLRRGPNKRMPTKQESKMPSDQIP